MNFISDFRYLVDLLDSEPEGVQMALLQWSKNPQSIAIAQSGGLSEFALYIAEFLDDATVEFFAEWLQTPFMHWVGADPFRRGAFAREAGFTEHMLGLWNRLHARSKIVGAAVAMFDGSGGGISDLKRAVKEFVEKKYRIYKMMAGSHVTYWPSLFETTDDAAKWAAEKDLAADLGLHEYLAVQDETTEEIAKYL